MGMLDDEQSTATRFFPDKIDTWPTIFPYNLFETFGIGALYAIIKNKGFPYPLYGLLVLFCHLI